MFKLNMSNRVVREIAEYDFNAIIIPTVNDVKELLNKLDMVSDNFTIELLVVKEDEVLPINYSNMIGDREPDLDETKDGYRSRTYVLGDDGSGLILISIQ